VRSSDLRSAAGLFGSTVTARVALLRALWPLAVGRDIAQRSDVVAMAADVMHVRVADARWRQVLFRMRREILFKLRQAAGDLAPRRLGFLEGVARARPAPPTPVPAPDPFLERAPAPLPAAVAAAARAIDDPVLRERFEQAATRYLERASVTRRRGGDGL
jgi:hypothetical protein